MSGLDGTAAGGAYNLRNGYSSPTGSLAGTQITSIVSGTLTGIGTALVSSVNYVGTGGGANATTWPARKINQILSFDPDLTSGSDFLIAEVDMSAGTTGGSAVNFDDLVAISLTASNTTTTCMVHRLTQLSKSLGGGVMSDNIAHFVLIDSATGAVVGNALEAVVAGMGANALSAPISDTFGNVSGNKQGAVRGGPVWGLENNASIPEIDIKVDSVAVTAVTKKLKAKWTPELGQDLNAYHNLDAEVELTQILSEQIALEIDREIVEDLVRGATGAVRYWSRLPGQFLNRETGAISSVTQDFTGNVSEWYETLVETINDVSAQIHRKTLRGAANFCVLGPEVANILEFTAGFRANVTADSDRADAGAVLGPLPAAHGHDR